MFVCVQARKNVYLQSLTMTKVVGRACGGGGAVVRAFCTLALRGPFFEDRNCNTTADVHFRILCRDKS